MKKNTIFLIFFGLSLVYGKAYADKFLMLKCDDGGIAKWTISNDFAYSFVSLDTPNLRHPIMKFTGSETEVFIPVSFIEWTYRDANNNVIIQNEWHDDWGDVAVEYSLSEEDGKAVFGDFPEDTPIDVFNAEDDSKVKYLTVTGQLEIGANDEFNVVSIGYPGIFVYPKNQGEKKLYNYILKQENN